MKVWPLTIRGTGAVLLGLACFVLAHAYKITELLYVCVLLLVAVGASLATLYLVRRTERVTRSFSPDLATVGTQVQVRLHVEIRSALPMTQGRWQDRLTDAVSGDASGVFPATASGIGTGSGAVEISYGVTALRRGIHSVGPLSVTSLDPFGFARRPHTVGAELSLTVAPAIVELGALSDLPGEAGGSMHSTTNQLGEGTDNLIPRGYVSGDSMRRIHWRASAHRDELMVRQEEQETTPEAIVVLDRSQHRWPVAAHREPGADPGFEAAVSACVSAAARLVHEGYVVHVIDADGNELSERVDAGDASGLERLAADFATVRAHHDVPLSRLVHRFVGVLTGPLVLVTGALEDADADLLAPLAHHSSLPVLLAVTPDTDVLTGAAAAGWRTGAIGPGWDLAAAWNAAVDRGVSHVGV